MAKNVTFKTEITEHGRSMLDDICDETYAWMGAESTIGDFFTIMFERMIEETLGEEICYMTIGEIEKDEKKAMLVLDALCKSKMFDTFRKVESAKDLI